MRLREMFIQVFMESVYPLHSLADLGSFSIAASQKMVVLLSADLLHLNYLYYVVCLMTASLRQNVKNSVAVVTLVVTVDKLKSNFHPMFQ